MILNRALAIRTNPFNERVSLVYKLIDLNYVYCSCVCLEFPNLNIKYWCPLFTVKNQLHHNKHKIDIHDLKQLVVNGLRSKKQLTLIINIDQNQMTNAG